MTINKLGIWTLIGILAAIFLGACAAQKEQMPTAVLPAGKAYSEGKEIFFIHTEASDPEIAELLTNMMSSPVLYVPSLADIPESSLAEVYVFENGLKGMGPLGYQVDVFANPPGAQGYTPVRRIILVKWNDPTQARELKSVAEIMAAKNAGQVTISQSDVVVNMPFVVWEGGKR